MIDICILSNAVSDYHKMLTDNCIDSLGKLKYNAFVHEQQNVYYKIPTFNFNEPFNYNRFMNKLAEQGKAEYIAFCNNDLTFEDGWDEKIVKAMIDHNLDSASPYCKITHPVQRISPTGLVRLGFNVRLEFAGWCFVMKRTSWEKIGGLDEDFSFWCADNATVMQLKQHNMLHGLVTNSFVTHIGEQTLKTVTPEEKEQMTFVQVKKFNKKYNENVWGLGI